MITNLKHKLSLLLLLSIAFSLLLVGVALHYFIVELHEQNAKQKFSSALQYLALEITARQGSLMRHAEVLAARPDIVSALNMVSEYQSVEDYEPIVFDVEKRKIATELEHSLQAPTRGQRSNRLVAAYDRHGGLVSFAQSANGDSTKGIMSFEQGLPLVYMASAASPSAWERSALPPLLRAVPVEMTSAPALKLARSNGGIVMASSAPVSRTLPNAERKPVGHVVLVDILGKEFADEIAKETQVPFTILTAGNQGAGFFTDVKFARQLDAAPPVLAGATEPGAGWIDHQDYFLQTSFLELGDGQRAYLVFSIDKQEVFAEIRRAQIVVFVVLLLSATVVVPLGIMIANRTISNPVQKLVAGAEAIKEGRYDKPVDVPTRDEIGLLARAFNEMAASIKDREEELQESRANLAEAQRIARLGNWVWHPNSKRLVCSNEICRIFGIPDRNCELSIETLARFIHDEDKERVGQAKQLAMTHGIPYAMDYRIMLPSGKPQVVHEQVEIQRDAAGKIARIIGTVQVVTELKAAEDALRKANRALKTLSSCNEALIHATNEFQLLQQVCRIIVGVGGYRVAWVGYAQHDEGKTIKIVARAGDQADYLDQVEFTWADTPQGQGPTGTAIRTGAPQLCQSTLTDPSFAPWRTEAVKRGFLAIISLPLLHDGTVFGALTLYSGESNAFDPAEIALLGELAGDLAFGINTLRARAAHKQAESERQFYMEKLQHSMEATIQAVATTIEKRDPYTAGHQHRVALLSRAIALELGLPETQAHGIYLAGMIHDIGKIYVPADILSRPGKLIDEEFDLLRSHARVGYDILKDVDLPWPVAQIILQHHERCDGTGYPSGLGADQILLEAKILAVADVVEAMASHRPYRPALGLEAALEEIEKNRGILYDTAAADACLRLFREKGFSFTADNAK